MAIGSCLKWHGGKHYLASKIRKLFAPHTRYCEPFFGGGSVLFSGDGEGVAEYANDLNHSLCRFWRVLADPDLFSEFAERALTTPFSEPHFDAYKVRTALEGAQPSHDDAGAALAFFVVNRQSRQGLGKDFAAPTSRLRRGMNEQVSAWLSAVDGLPEFHSRLRRVEIRNQPAVEFIKELDSPETLFYCDPPYMHETRSSTGEYAHEMTDEQHGDLLTVLSNIKGKFCLSGYRSQIYDEAADAYGWRRVDFDLPNNASSKKTKERKTESVWMNY